MEKITKIHYTLFAFVLAGLLFSGYLAGTKLFSDTCAFGASCPFFLGYPACYTGFIVYFILAIVSILALVKKELTNTLLLIITGVSLFGLLFSGKLTLEEMQVLFDSGLIAFIKSLPLCSIGLIFYTAIFGISLTLGKPEGEVTPPCCAGEKKEEVKIEATVVEKKIDTPTIVPATTITEPMTEEVKVEDIKTESDQVTVFDKDETDSLIEEVKVEEAKIEDVK